MQVSARHSETFVKSLEFKAEKVIPTTFVPLAPDKIFSGEQIDLLFGVFHIMWKDMPKPKGYSLRLAEEISSEGSYLGCRLKYGFMHTETIEC